MQITFKHSSENCSIMCCFHSKFQHFGSGSPLCSKRWIRDSLSGSGSICPGEGGTLKSVLFPVNSPPTDPPWLLLSSKLESLSKEPGRCNFVFPSKKWSQLFSSVVSLLSSNALKESIVRYSCLGRVLLSDCSQASLQVLFSPICFSSVLEGHAVVLPSWRGVCLLSLYSLVLALKNNCVFGPCWFVTFLEAEVPAREYCKALDIFSAKAMPGVLALRLFGTGARLSSSSSPSSLHSAKTEKNRKNTLLYYANMNWF